MIGRSWGDPNHPLNKMLHCGEPYDWWIVQALEYLPSRVRDEFRDKLAFYSTARRDGCRIARAICKEREIILLSERVLPRSGAQMDDEHTRYFIFTVLHEVAHAVRKHRSAVYDHLTNEENDAQEREADELGLSWFNAHTKEKYPDLSRMTIDEVQAARDKNKRLMEQTIKGA